MDARLTQVCALVRQKSRTLDEIALALKSTKQMAALMTGRLVAAGVLGKDGDTVTVADDEKARAIAAGEIDKLPMRQRKKRVPKTSGSKPGTVPLPKDDSVACFAKDEDGCLNISRRDGEGTTMIVPADELPRLMAYLRVNFRDALGRS